MTYQVLARKWRPQTFSSLIGQGPIVTALRNALSEGRIAQAYLFSGIRGVGKTTAARLLAKSLNCEAGPTPEPCNECTPCREITRGADMDVLEIDAATYSKVEQVRDLTESLRYGPARDRYKVVVLDEIHRLSRQAFDALLKTVEEPPSHLVFIFATTEIEAVPATLLSRCQEFHFRRVPSALLATHLRDICEHEDIDASDTALRLVARAGEGSVRDSVALLDQLATFGGGSVADDDAVHLLGGLDTALFRSLLEDIVEGRSAAVTEAVSRIEEEGWDPRQVYAQFLAYCRDGLHLALGGDPQHIDLPEEEAVSLAELATGTGYENLLRLLQQLLSSEATVRRSEAGALAVEIAWLRAAELPKLTRVEELLGGGPPKGSQSSAERSPSPSRHPPSPRGEAHRPRPEPPPAPAPQKAETPPRVPAPAAAGNNRGDRERSFLEEVSRRKQALGAYLREGIRSLELVDGRLLIELSPEDTLLRQRLERQANQRLLDEVVPQIWGEGTHWALAEAAREGTGDSEVSDSTETAAVDHDPSVQAVLDLFGGRVEAVEDHETIPED